MGTMYGIIEQLCSERGIKPGKLCADLEISRGILSDLKAGRTKKLSAENIAKISAYFGVTTDYLVYGTQTNSVTAYANGICAYTGSTMQEIEGKLAEREPGSFRIVYRGAGVVVTVDTDSAPSDDQINAVIAVYDPNYAQKEKAPANSDERKDVLDEVDVAFYGDFKELSEDDKATVRDMVRIMRERRAKRQE